MELLQDRHGYYNDYEHEEDAYENWVDEDMDDEFSERQAWLLACRALGLGEPAEGCGFVVNEALANVLLRPSGLDGRLRGVTPKMAAEVLRRCARGMPPQDAWALVGQGLRVSLPERTRGRVGQGRSRRAGGEGGGLVPSRPGGKT